MVTVTNEGNTDVTDGRLALGFGDGFRVQRPTIRGGTIASESQAELVLDVGAITAGDSVTVEYAGTVVGVRGARIVNDAHAQGVASNSSTVQSDTAAVTVRLRATVLESRFAVGRVWLDDDGDGRFGAT